MIKKLIKKVKDFWCSPKGIVTTGVGAIIAILTTMLISHVTVFTYIGAITGAIVIVLIVGMIFILQIAQESEED